LGTFATAAVGQDFGADTAAFDPTVEFESDERIVEGCKRAADGARYRVFKSRRQAVERAC